MKKTLFTTALTLMALLLSTSFAVAGASSAPTPATQAAPQVQTEETAATPQMSKREQRRAERLQRRMERKMARANGGRPLLDRLAIDEGLKKALIWYGIAIGISVLSSILGVIGIAGGVIGLVLYLASVAAGLYATYLLIMWLIEEA
mgnify:CR=1 FL=1